MDSPWIVPLILVTLWVTFIFATGEIAGSRGHARTAWYLAAILFGPVAMLAAFVAPFTPAKVAAALVEALAEGGVGRPSPVAARDTGTGTGPEPMARDQDPGGGAWRVTHSTRAALPIGAEVGIERQERRLVIAGEGRVVTLEIDALRARVSSGALALEGEGGLRLVLSPIDGQDAQVEAEALGMI